MIAIHYFKKTAYSGVIAMIKKEVDLMPRDVRLECPVCGGIIDDGDEYCEGCGANLNEDYTF